MHLQQNTTLRFSSSVAVSVTRWRHLPAYCKAWCWQFYLWISHWVSPCESSYMKPHSCQEYTHSVLCFCPYTVYEYTQLPSQQALTEGRVPPFYANKVQLSYSVDNAPTHIFLCILSMYMYVHDIVYCLIPLFAHVCWMYMYTYMYTHSVMQGIVLNIQCTTCWGHATYDMTQSRYMYYPCLGDLKLTTDSLTFL